MLTMRYDLLQLPGVKSLLKSRWPQWVAQLLALGGFAFAILAGLSGSPVGSHNFSIIFVWIAWWALLMLMAVPFFGRGWCSVCPIPLPGEWLQRGALMAPNPKGGLGLGWRWPTRLRNIWLQNVAFALVALFSAVVLTQPIVTSFILAAFLLIALVVSLAFERRAFCRYLCPVGGFIGLYSQAAPLEIRVKDTALCANHREKTCYTGSADGYGCPWQAFPGGLVKNTNCGLCLECLRTCPHDNIALNFRAPGDDLRRPGGRKLDEACKAFVMLGSALSYALVMLGPWGAIKSAAYTIGSAAWLGYALAFLAFNFIALPGLFWLAVERASRGNLPRKKAFIAFAYALVPLGLAAWIAFSLAFVFTNASYLLPVLSDPLGWGWNLFGTAAVPWTPYFTEVVPFLQMGVLIGGLAWATALTKQIAHELRLATRQAWPVSLFCFLITAAMLWLLIG